MNQAAINQGFLFEAINLAYTQLKPSDAIEKVDLVLQTEKSSFAYLIKASILRDTNKLEEALGVINEGLGHDLKSHTLLKLKAELLSSGQYPDTQGALNCIRLAQIYFEESSKVMKKYMEAFPAEKRLEYSNQYIGTQAALQILESHIRSLADIVYVLNKTKNLEKQLEGERIRTIELLGLFTAILAFIFSSVHIITTLALQEALVLLTGVALLLIFFLLSLHMVLDVQGRTRNLIALLAILTFVIFGLPWYAGLLEKTQSTNNPVAIESLEDSQ